MNPLPEFLQRKRSAHTDACIEKLEVSMDEVVRWVQAHIQLHLEGGDHHGEAQHAKAASRRSSRAKNGAAKPRTRQAKAGAVARTKRA